APRATLLVVQEAEIVQRIDVIWIRLEHREVDLLGLVEPARAVRGNRGREPILDPLGALGLRLRLRLAALQCPPCGDLLAPQSFYSDASSPPNPRFFSSASRSRAGARSPPGRRRSCSLPGANAFCRSRSPQNPLARGPRARTARCGYSGHADGSGSPPKLLPRRPHAPA